MSPCGRLAQRTPNMSTCAGTCAANRFSTLDISDQVGRVNRTASASRFAALLNLDADAVGFTRPTWSLMSNVENRFAAHVPAQVDMFGVRWAILPRGDTPPAGSLQAATAGDWVLWSTGDIGYLSVVDTVAPVAVDRTDLGLRMAAFLSSNLPLKGRYPTLAWAGAPGAEPTLGPGDEPHDAAGERA